jgi:hypothetical protein
VNDDLESNVQEMPRSELSEVGVVLGVDCWTHLSNWWASSSQSLDQMTRPMASTHPMDHHGVIWVLCRRRGMNRIRSGGVLELL